MGREKQAVGVVFCRMLVHLCHARARREARLRRAMPIAHTRVKRCHRKEGHCMYGLARFACGSVSLFYCPALSAHTCPAASKTANSSMTIRRFSSEKFFGSAERTELELTDADEANRREALMRDWQRRRRTHTLEHMVSTAAPTPTRRHLHSFPSQHVVAYDQRGVRTCAPPRFVSIQNAPCGPNVCASAASAECRSAAERTPPIPACCCRVDAI